MKPFIPAVNLHQIYNSTATFRAFFISLNTDFYRTFLFLFQVSLNHRIAFIKIGFKVIPLFVIGPTTIGGIERWIYI